MAGRIQVKKSPTEILRANTLTERAMAILSGKTKRLDKLNSEIERLRTEIVMLRAEVMKSNSTSPTNQPNQRRQQ